MPDSVGGAGFPSNINIGHEHLNIENGLTYQYQGGVPTNVLNWKIIGGVTPVDPSTVGWGLNQLGAIWYNSRDNVYKYWDGTTIQVITFGPPQQQTTLYPFRTTIELQDEFFTGANSNGLIGSLGWAVSGGTSTVSSTSNAIGFLRRDTSAVAATVAATFNNTAGGLLDPGVNHALLWRIRIVTNDNATTVRVGENSQTSANPPPNGIYFEKLDTDVNWFCVTRAAGVQTRVDSGVATTGNFVNLAYTRDSSGVTWIIDQVPVGATSTTNIPTVFGSAATQVINTGAVAKQLDHDYFQIQITGLNR